MTAIKPPWRTGKPPETVNLSGRLVPFQADGQPVLFAIPGSDLHHIACFADEALMRATLERAGIAFDGIKQIDDGPEFLSSIPRDIQVIVDPWWTSEGRLRFTLVLRD